MIDGPLRVAFCKLTVNVRAYVSRAFDQRPNAWMIGGKKSPEPTQRRVELEFFGGQSDSMTAMRLGKAGSRIWTQLLRANIYPEVAHLYSHRLLTEQDLEHIASTARVTMPACWRRRTPAEKACYSKLAESPFWPHRVQLMKLSSKFAKLCVGVEDMLAYRDRQLDIHGPALLTVPASPSYDYQWRPLGVATQSVPNFGRQEMTTI
ncbi:hypothetical protein DL770_000568 [Monosporascus sp. CRB-9-2]|nr:hypothetical protein DL770_000568 [Monosporascus sp. CRB-9-2]